ncbi:hypothetical protein HOY80DRAFT_1038167 [Tuber brumale]|nr:hypothetical protein HOY80DRAFT_1038167 [Tuber brumale]
MIKIADIHGPNEKTLEKVIINMKACEEGEISTLSTCITPPMPAAIRKKAVHPNLPRVD